MTFTIMELRECVEREVRRRARVYPNRLETGRMSAREAGREIAMMREIADRLRAQEEAQMLV